MAAVTECKKVAVAIKLNNGTTKTGAPKTVSVSLGKLDKSAFDAQKAINIVNVLVPCLDRSLNAIEKTEVSELYEE